MKFTGERVVPTDMHANVDTYQQHLARYVWVLDKVVNKSVIDAACGTGYGTALLSSVASKVLGGDISPEAISYAVEYYGHLASFAQINFDAVRPLSKSVPNAQDVVVSFETIEHLENPKNFLLWCQEIAPVVIGSIPINCPTEFHKHNYGVTEIRQMVTSIFKEVQFFYQNEMDISPLGSSMFPSFGMVLFIGKR